MSFAHPFDTTIALQPEDAHHFRGIPGHDYWNFVGPFGGTTAATLLHAVMLHPERLGEPAALTLNYSAPLADAPFVLEARPVRTNRSTQHWTLSLTQADAAGAHAVVATGTAVTALRRETWAGTDLPMPQVPAAAQLQPVGVLPGFNWSQHYDLRMAEGGYPTEWDKQERETSRTRIWVRDLPPRPLDFCALAAQCDMFYPRVWLRRALHTPAGTVTLTIYFHASQAELDAAGDAHVLGEATGQEYRHGFFDQSARLWSAAGSVLATSHQLVYFRE